MVNIREESSEPYNPSASDGAGSSRAQTSRPAQGRISISQYVSENLMDCCLLATRLMTLFFTLCYLLSFLSPIAPDSAYYKAFDCGSTAAAATNALRMQQRVGTVSFTREFLARLLLEDSCHYLFYAILFLTSAPVTMALLPISLFAALHAASQMVKLLTAIGYGGSMVAARLTSLAQQHTTNCLGIIACGEIFLVPVLISMIFVGKASLFVPFVYYRFLTLRYASQRNPSTRQAFAQMRYSLDQVAASPNCPQIVRSLIYNSVAFISRLAPVA
ncbi:Transmembrane protein 33 [Trichostrongylus colubriformis]|uniref:Transmembrane protein 33 n=1 Tax=Trichostrongylus colubriformis TaxID=6319 RepID=A0AAN8EUT2_TRICO